MNIFTFLIYLVTFGVICLVLIKLMSYTFKRNKMSFRESMDLVDLPIVTFYNGERKLNFLLDTGSNVSYINEVLVDGLEIEETGKNDSFMGIDGCKHHVRLIEMELMYKGKTKYTEVFHVANLSGAFDIIKQENGTSIHGILGSKFFEKIQLYIGF